MDNNGYLDNDEVKGFVARLLKDTTPDLDNFDKVFDKHRIIFAGLDDNDSSSLNKEDLHKFLREILKEQIKEL